MQNLKRDLPIIGVLAGWAITSGEMSDRYLVSVLSGIQSAARLKRCHLLVAWGLGHVPKPGTIQPYPAWPVVAPDSDFVPVGPWNTDGLIVVGSLLNESRSVYLQQLRDQGFPVFFISTGEKAPMVSVDNDAGIRQAVAHLVEHGHRQIAFVAGNPNSQGDSRSRLRAYHAAVAEFGLSTDPRLVEPGWHEFTLGYEAARKIIGSGVGATAIMASDDSSAIGAMQAIRDAGLQIPRDIAVIGFDDQPDAIAQVPPLTSVHIPLQETGEQALLIMLDHLTGRHELESVCIPARLALRQSCGCAPEVVASAADRQARLELSTGSPDAHINVSDVKQKLVEEMVAVLSAESRFADEEQTRRICETLLDAFHKSLQTGKSTYFQKSTTVFLHELEATDGGIDPWQEIVSVLRREMIMLPADWGDIKTRLIAEDLLHQIRAAISESAQRMYYRHQYKQDAVSQALSELTAGLSVTLDERQAVQLLESRMADIDVQHARVALFQAEGDDPVAWSLIPNSDADSAGQRFPTREFPPPGVYPLAEVLNLALVPLVFQSEPLGYVVFDGANFKPYAAIARQLTATLKTSRLYAQVLELSLRDPLTGLSNRRYFDLFLKNEVERNRRHGHAFAVVMLDIDQFKNYNDSFGHIAGDKALQAVACCIQEDRRGADVAARFGGEEFALILPDTEIDGALAVVRKIQAALTSLSNLERTVTLSAGITVSQGTIDKPETLIQQADQALYEAKQTGRDRICVFGPNGSL